MPSAWLDDMPPIAFKLGHYLNAKMTSWGGTNMASAMLFYLFAQSTSLLPAPAFQNENLVNFAAAYNLGCHRNSNVCLLYTSRYELLSDAPLPVSENGTVAFAGTQLALSDIKRDIERMDAVITACLLYTSSFRLPRRQARPRPA